MQTVVAAAAVAVAAVVVAVAAVVAAAAVVVVVEDSCLTQLMELEELQHWPKQIYLFSKWLRFRLRSSCDTVYFWRQLQMFWKNLMSSTLKM
jgi:hypothetical protein